MFTQAFIEEMKIKLIGVQRQLQDDLANLKPHDELGSDVDASVQEIEEDEVNQDLIAKISADLAKIQKALAKIDSGTYGTDDNGQPISEERLRALPWADKAV